MGTTVGVAVWKGAGAEGCTALRTVVRGAPVVLGAPEPNDLERAGSGVTSAEATSSLGVAFMGDCSAAASAVVGTVPGWLAGAAADVAAGVDVSGVVVLGSGVGCPAGVLIATGGLCVPGVLGDAGASALPGGGAVNASLGVTGAAVPGGPEIRAGVGLGWSDRAIRTMPRTLRAAVMRRMRGVGRRTFAVAFATPDASFWGAVVALFWSACTGFFCFLSAASGRVGFLRPRFLGASCGAVGASS